MKKAMYLLFLISFIFVSCSKSEVDMRDDYVGTWNEEGTGSMSLISNGTALTTIPMDFPATSIEVTKTGTNQLIIDGETATVSGSKLSIASISQTETQNGVTMTVNASYTGSVSKTLMTVKETYSGNWSASGMSGTIGGSVVYTFTR